MANLQVVADAGAFVVQDMDTGYAYGRYKTRQEADEALENWKVYLES